MEQSTFPNYMEVKQKIPDSVWYLCRVISLSMILAIIYLLFTYPKTGLFIFWGLCVPILPLLFFLAPGLWRNICPLATMNQLPREFGFTRGKAASKFIKEYGFLFAILVGFTIIPARHLLFNQDAKALAVLLILALCSPFILGMIYKGKSGWCSTMCPVMPFQRVYGQTPFFKVRNHHCRPCVGCTENCYDFNPAISYVMEMNSKKKHHRRFRHLFIGALPGFIYAFYAHARYTHVSVWSQYVFFIEFIAISVLLFQFLIAVLKSNEAKTAMIFASVAINLYYFFTIPIVISDFSQRFLLTIPGNMHWYLQAPILALTVVWVVRTYHLQDKIITTLLSTEPQRSHLNTAVKQQSTATAAKMRITIADSNRVLLAERGEKLLDVLERSGIDIESGCRSGACGADPVCLLKGSEGLQIESSEKRTINRSGFSDKTRMACCVLVEQDMTISMTTADNMKAPSSDETESMKPDEIKSIVVIGSGIAANTFLDTVKSSEKSAHYSIICLSDENYEFYNRMAIAKLFYNNKGTKEIQLPISKIRKQDELYLNVRVTKADMETKTIETSMKKSFKYDYLVLATGSIPFKPPIKGINSEKVFVVNQADDVMTARRLIHQHDYKRAVVWGGGVLGIETACALAKAGIHVNLYERFSHVMQRNLDKEAADMLAQQLMNQSVSVSTGRTIESLNTTDDEVTVTLDNNETITTDIVFVCLGFRPQTQLANETKLNVNKGVLVDSNMRTNLDDVYAIGACAESSDGSIPVLWQNAAWSGEVAAKHLLGLPVGEHVSPHEFLVAKIPGVHLVSVGQLEADADSDTVIQHVDAQALRYKKIILRDNVIVGYILMGHNMLETRVRQWYQQQVNVEPYLDVLQNESLSVS